MEQDEEIKEEETSISTTQASVEFKALDEIKTKILPMLFEKI